MAVNLLVRTQLVNVSLSCLVRRDRPSRARAWSMEMLGAALNALAGEAFRMGDVVEGFECFSRSSPIVALRREMGIRLTRRSMRDRRSFACRAYCERSLRALSVTADLSALFCLLQSHVPLTFKLEVVDQRLLLALGQTHTLCRRAGRGDVGRVSELRRLAFQSSHFEGGELGELTE